MSDLLVRFLRLFSFVRECERRAVEATERAEGYFSEREQYFNQRNDARMGLLQAKEDRDRLSASLEKERHELRELAERKTQVDDEVRALRARLDELEPELAAARAEAVRGSQMVADWLAQQMFGRPVFGVGLPLPEKDQTVRPVQRGRVTAREVSNRLTAEFFNNYRGAQTAPAQEPEAN